LLRNEVQGLLRHDLWLQDRRLHRLQKVRLLRQGPSFVILRLAAASLVAWAAGAAQAQTVDDTPQDKQEEQVAPT